MMIKSILFCAFALGASAMVAKLSFPAAALPLETVQNAASAQSAELFDDIELPDFGQISVLDMMQYYMENPPIIAESNGSEPKKVRFQGC